MSARSRLNGRGWDCSRLPGVRQVCGAPLQGKQMVVCSEKCRATRWRRQLETARGDWSDSAAPTSCGRRDARVSTARRDAMIASIHARKSMGGYQLPILVAFAVAVGSCVSLTPQQQDKVADVQRFADATAAAYNLSRIRVTIEPATNLGIGGRYRQGNFYLNVRMLGSGGLTAVVAHELAHYVLRHEPISGVSVAELQRVQELRELDANAKAVEILMRVRGMSQTEAVRTMATHLRRAQAVTGCGGALAPGHCPPADEMADLLSRFPDSAPLLAELEESIPLDSKDPSASAGAPAAEKPAAPSAVAALRVP